MLILDWFVSENWLDGFFYDVLGDVFDIFGC